MFFVIESLLLTSCRASRSAKVLDEEDDAGNPGETDETCDDKFRHLGTSSSHRISRLTPKFSCKHVTTIATKSHPKVLGSCNVR